jgi:predicted outer membrane repeat protein
MNVTVLKSDGVRILSRLVVTNPQMQKITQSVAYPVDTGYEDQLANESLLFATHPPSMKVSFVFYPPANKESVQIVNMKKGLLNHFQFTLPENDDINGEYTAEEEDASGRYRSQYAMRCGGEHEHIHTLITKVSSGLPQCSLLSPFAYHRPSPQDLMFLPERSGLRRSPRQCLSFPFATLGVVSWTELPSATDAPSTTELPSATDDSSPTNMWVANTTTTVVVHRRLTEVSKWEEMKTACGSSGTVTVSDGFTMGMYTPTLSPQYGGIDFSGKQLVIIGNNKVLNAGEKGRFFYGSGSGSSLEVRNVTMRNGKVSDTGSGGGGAIYISEDGALVIHDSTFDTNTANWEGGAIYAYAGANVEIHDSTFQANAALSYRGGAIHVQNGVQVEIYTSEFKKNQADVYGGGAIYAINGANVQVHDSIFQNNTATGEYGYGNYPKAGAIYVNQGTVEIYGSMFERNQASFGNGGAIYIHESKISIYDSTFESNQATCKNGGAIFIWESRISIYTSTFEANRAGRAGGAIYVKGAPLVMDDCIARNNSATSQGHFLATYDTAWATLELTNVTMSEPEDGMGGKHLIDLGAGSTTNSAYASITLVGCSVEGAGAKSNTIKARTGAVAIYRNENLTTDPAIRRETETCNSTASFRWVHAARLLICQCEAGKYRSQEEACMNLNCTSTQPLLCSACPVGYYQSAVDAKTCTPCAVGRYSLASLRATACIRCGAGTYSAAEATACDACSAGEYQDTAGQGYCRVCLAGSRTDMGTAVGASSCIACAAGRYSSASNVALCTPCGAGSITNSGASSGATLCTECVAGKYSTASSVAACTECTAGKYVGTMGSRCGERLRVVCCGLDHEYTRW